MSKIKNISVRKSSLFMIVGIVVFIVYIYFFIGFNEIVRVVEKLNSTHFVIFYSAALIAELVAVFSWSSAWKMLLKSLSVEISFRKTYLYYWAGYFLDLVIPCETVCGEIARLYLVKRETRKDYGPLAASAITNRILAYLIVTSGLFAVAVFVFLEPKFPAYLLNLFLLILGGASVYLVILLYLAFNKQAARKITSIYLKLYKFFARKKDEKEEVSKRVNNALSNYYEGFAHFRKEPKHLVKPFLLHALAYLLNLTVYFFVFYALNIKSLSIGFLIVVYFITTAVQDASASFSVGSLDILLTTIFAFYGINSARSGVTAVTIRSTAFWFPLLVSFVSFQIVGARKVLKSQKEESTKADKLQYN